MEETPAPVTPGAQSSEFKLASRGSWIGIALMVAGAVVDVAAELVDVLTPLAKEMPNVKWLGTTLLICGAIVKIATVLGYAKARASVKAAALAAGKTTLVLLALLLAAPAFAQQADPTAATVDTGAIVADAVANSGPDRRFGGCSRSGFLCAGPSVSVALVAWDLKRERFVSGFQPGLGYGVDLWANQWWKTGLSVNAALAVESGDIRAATLSAVLSFAEYLRFGYGYEVIAARDDGTRSSRGRYLLFGLGADFGK
jgi:hypothetical protein